MGKSESPENLKKPLPGAPIWYEEGEGTRKGVLLCCPKLCGNRGAELARRVEGHAVAGGELTNSRKAIEGGTGCRPCSGAQRDRDVEGCSNDMEVMSRDGTPDERGIEGWRRFEGGLERIV
jgi:hypothetical protein